VRGAALRDPESGASVPVAASVGLAIYPTEANKLEELINLADSAMYAAKRQRPVGAAGKTLPRPLASERAARLVGEMVPLLTSPGDLDNKLRLVAHRLSVGAGYDGVHFALFAPHPGAPVASSVFARAPDDLIEAWQRTARRDTAEPDPIRAQLDRGRRPIILEDAPSDERLTEEARDLLRAAGLRSALVAPMLWRNELIGSLGVASRQKSAFGPRDAQFLMAVATEVTAIVRMATLVEELQSTSTHLAQARAEAVIMLAAAAEAHDQTTGFHLQNVRAITEALARELGYSEEDAGELGLAAVLHDIGKVRVPDSVLSVQASSPTRNGS
jgi:GAF domain-containing protein